MSPEELEYEKLLELFRSGGIDRRSMIRHGPGCGTDSDCVEMYGDEEDVDKNRAYAPKRDALLRFRLME